MDEKALSLVVDSPLGLSHDILKKLESYEDYLSFYIQLDQASTAFAWLKADLLFQMAAKLGETSIEQLARDISQPRSTVINYVRTARAFPMEQRSPAASFSLHMRASFADAYDEKTGFQGDERFKWVDKAVDEGLSTREVGEAIQRDKLRESLGVAILPCSRCDKTDGTIKPFVMYSPGGHIEANRFELHDTCLNEVTAFIYGNKER